MQPLVDADVLRYEVGFGAETAWEGEGSPPFDKVAELLDNRIANICAIVGATVPPRLYLTGKGNFRYDIAKRQPYKDRPSAKPFHFHNLTAYMKARYHVIESSGMEADDLMAIHQTGNRSLIEGNPLYRGPETIICTRDKDLRQVPGWHYGWELGFQPSFGPELVTEIGYINLSKDRKSIKGTGMLFFYSQLLTGDRVDSIPGLQGMGPVGAFNILDGCTDTKDALKRVYGAYRRVYGLSAYKEMLEQGRLLWMTRELWADGSPKLWGQTGKDM